MTERSAYVWYYDGTAAKAQQVADTGATLAWVKAGGDKGVAWIPGAPTGGFANHQWDAGYLTPLTSRGVECLAWFYNWPVLEDQQVVGDVLAVRWSPRIVLNVETEWRVGTPSSPYNTLAQANAYATAWVLALKAQLLARFGRVPSIGFSSCPSWADFPYEGFAAACDFAHPQHYWPANLLNGEDQVTAHYRRAPQTPCVAVLTACGEYDDAGVLDLARSALLHPIDGLSAWEAGNAAYQAAAMKEAYAMLPQDNLVTNTTTAAPSPIVTPAQNWGEGSAGVVIFRAETIVALNDGKRFLGLAVNGQPVPLDGTNPWKEL